jgi:predicted GH43/DUF377 family glycosyl hydrolase
MSQAEPALQVTRLPANPLLSPKSSDEWQARATFNPSVIKETEGRYHLLYRAISGEKDWAGQRLSLSILVMPKVVMVLILTIPDN